MSTVGGSIHRTKTPAGPRTRVVPLAAVALAFLVGCGGEGELAGLLRQLKDEDVSKRRQAAQDLGATPAMAIAAQPQLVDALADPDRDVRRLSCRALGQAGPEARDSVPRLALLLADKELSVRVAAAFSIRRIDPREASHTAVLIDMMRRGDGGVIVEVGRMGEDAAWAVPTLSKLLTSDGRPGTRRLAAGALEQIGLSNSAVKVALNSATRDPDDRVRDAALRALKSLEQGSSVN